MIKNHIQFKDESLKEMFFQVHPYLSLILCSMGHYCYLKKQDFTITDLISTHERDKKLGRKSTTHIGGRAADIRIFNWSKEFTKEFISYFNQLQGIHGAVFNGEKRLLVLKSDHIHIQLNRTFSVFKES